MNNAVEYLHDLHVSPLGAWLLAGYALVVGGAFGSFLNVVAYRLPLGMSLNRPGSRCPHCERPIRWHHNVPVFGWLLLRGRCHDCGEPIAARYPIVELLGALASGLVFWSALEPAVGEGGREYAVDLLAVGFRLVLVYLLFCTALLEFDCNRLPLWLLNVSLLLALLLLRMAPELRPMVPDGASIAPIRSSVMAVVAGFVLALLAWPAWVIHGASAELRDARARATLLVLIGLVLGETSLLIVTAAAVSLALSIQLIARVWPPAASLGWASSLLIATLGWMLATGPTVAAERVFQIGPTSLVLGDRQYLLLIVGCAVAVLSLIGRFLRVRDAQFQA